MGVLDRVAVPSDLRDLTDAELEELAAEIRERVIAAVARNSGHLGPNLGVVELTLALHRVFDSPRDPILWDVGHQAYVHKIITGRADGLDRLRQRGGPSGYPSAAESVHDVIENSHASTSLSYADGMAKAFALQGEDRTVVAVIGDGGLTGGMAWEALNNIAADTTRRVVIVVNDNGRSYQPTIGGVALHLASLRTNPRYEEALARIKDRLKSKGRAGDLTYDVLHAVKKGLKDAFAPQGLFEDLGLKYVGPIDGHDRPAVEQALQQAKSFGGPVLVHVITTKGHGYDIAVANEEDQMHQSHPFDPETGDLITVPGETWTSAFRETIADLADERSDLVGVTAAMLYPTGLDLFAQRYPERVFDVGIAEQHAVTSAAGLALAGLHPVVAIYSTFLNRAFDQVLMDVALHRCGVTFVLDRAGITGTDGPSHNGMWDLSILGVVPGLRVAAPRDASTVRELLREAVAISDGPTVLRFPKASVGDDIPALSRVGSSDILVREGSREVLVVGVGAMVATCVDVAAKLVAEGVGVTVVDPRWVRPVDDCLVDLAASHGQVVTVEDSGRAGGAGAALAQALIDAECRTPVRIHAIPQRFLGHDKREAILDQVGLSADRIAADTLAALRAGL